MTELRKRMIESLQLRALSERTQEAYVRAVRQLADHCHKSPDQISEEELRQYFLYIKNVKKYSRAASTIAICVIKFFYEKTLGREFTTLELVRAPREKKLPVILSVEEVQTILGAGETATLSSVSGDDLLVRVAVAGRHTHSSAGHRQRAGDAARAARERREGSLCAAARAHGRVVKGVLADAPQPCMDVPIRRPGPR
jgi:integrase